MLKDSPVDIGSPPIISPSAVGVVDLDDQQLTAFARRGNSDAFGVLFGRHRQVALRLARHLAPRSEADDIVSEAFAQVFTQLRKGAGPSTQFRAYLLTSVRHESGRRAKARQRVLPTDDTAQIDNPVEFHDRVSESFEDETVRRAFDSLPDRWREVLWHLDIQGSKPQDVADELSLTPNGVSALGYRARNGLREAYVQAHVSEADSQSSDLCADARPMLAGYVRGSLSRRDARRLEGHLDGCVFCAGAHAEVLEVNQSVAALGAVGALSLTSGWWAKPLVGLKALGAAAAVPVAASALAVGLVTTPLTPMPDVNAHLNSSIRTVTAISDVSVGRAVPQLPKPSQPVQVAAAVAPEADVSVPLVPVETPVEVSTKSVSLGLVDIDTNPEQRSLDISVVGMPVSRVTSAVHEAIDRLVPPHSHDAPLVGTITKLGLDHTTSH